MSVWAIVVAAGSGTRFGRPKQFELVGGRTVLEHSLAAAARECDGVVVVLPPRRSLPGASTADRVVAGGPTRSASVRAGLVAVPPEAEVIVVHDAARPLASPALFAAVLAPVLAGAAAALPAVPLADTVRRVGGGVVDRDELVAVQTPQAFRADALRRAHASEPEATDDATLVEQAGGPVVVVAGEPSNLKVTRPEDLAVVEALLGRNLRPAPGRGPGPDLSTLPAEPGSGPGPDLLTEPAEPGSVPVPDLSTLPAEPAPGPGPRRAPRLRTEPAEPVPRPVPDLSTLPAAPGPGGRVRMGHGFDVHPFSADPARALVLGGVRFPDHAGLAGHSDADVIAHAVTDALLGAAGLGDIGQLFPDTDPAHAGADSLELLAEAVRQVRSAGWTPGNVDCTVVAESPKLAPRRAEIEGRLSAVVGAPVSVKGKRAEGLGALGRREGVACWAVAVLVATVPSMRTSTGW